MVGRFFLITFALSWSCFFAALRLAGWLQSGMLFVGTIAPALVALALMAWADGRVGLNRFFSGRFVWASSARWYLFAIGYFAVIKATAAIAYRLLAGAWPRFGSEAWYVIAIAIVISTPVQAGEEIGWRGYALPRLAARLGLRGSSVLLGIVWAVWHLPLFFLPTADKFGQSFIVYLLGTTTLSVAMAWLYAHTNGSLWMTMLMHSAVNQTTGILLTAVPGAGNVFALSHSLIAWLTVTLMCISGRGISRPHAGWNTPGGIESRYPSRLTAVKRQKRASQRRVPSRTGSGRSSTAARTALVALAVLVVVATTGRATSIAARNSDASGIMRVSGDEFIYLTLGDRLWHEGRYTASGIEEQLASFGITPPKYLAAPIFKHPPVFSALLGFSRLIGGGGVMPGYWLVLLLSALSIAATYWACQELALGSGAGLLAATLVAVSPVHWISSTHIWLDLPAATFILLGIGATLRATRHERWWAAAGLFWTCALLTKYVMAVAWVASLGAVLWHIPEARRSRSFWVSQSAVLLLAGGWAVFQLAADRIPLTHLAGSPIDDWRALGRAGPTVLVVAAVAIFMTWAATRVQTVTGRWNARASSTLIGTTAIACVGAAYAGLRASLWDVPWAGWLTNELVSSPRTFYIFRQLLFEPAVGLGFASMLVPSSRRDALITWPLAALLVFLTCWGNYQSRYALPLVALELILAARLIALVFAEPKDHLVPRVLAVLWVVVSVTRSAMILTRMGTDVFYF